MLQKWQNIGNNHLACVRHCGVYQRQKAYLLAGCITPCNGKGWHVRISRGSGQKEGSMRDRNQTNHPENSNGTGKSLYEWQTLFSQHYECTYILLVPCIEYLDIASPIHIFH